MKRFALLFALMAAIVPVRAHAAAGAWTTAGPVEARLIAAVDATGDRTTLPLALEIRLAPGWKTYWRSPGDAGLPPAIDWAGSENLAGAELAYPAPHRFTVLDIETVGYDGRVTFPVRAKLREPGRPVALHAAVDLLVCADICVPQRVVLALKLPAGAATPGAEAEAVAAAEAAVPGDGAAAGLAVTAVRAMGAALEVEATAREPFVSPDLFVETDPALAFAAPAVRFADGDRRVVMRLALADPKPEPAPDLAGRALTLTLVDGRRAMERGAVAVAGAAVAEGPGLPAMLALALLGGLILNLMPCVLPVLSLKLLSVIEHGGRAPRMVRAGFLASAAGILASFLGLAAAMVALKTAGAAVGWGIQFQQPLFLVFMVVLVTLFAANLWGLFEVPLPRVLADALGGREGGGLGGQFATGAFATLLATPCSAPFLGTAVGFALSRGPGEIVAVFLALGIGLASPYLLVAAVPRVAAVLPRPGRWMATLRRVLGVALALTAVWLLSVLAVQAGPEVAGPVAGLMAATLAALAIVRHGPRALGRAGAALAGVLALAAFAVPVAFGPPAAAVAPAKAAGRWVPFDEAAIGAHVAAGRVVFVDVTAEWCITCLANKRLVIDRGAVAERLGGASATVVAMRADWTRPDPAVSQYLARHGRYGIPFNMVYGPGAPGGIALPELLTERAVLDALDAAAGRG